MYTKARIAGHPIHPALVAFPIAMYTATVVGLLAFVGTHDGFWYRAAMWTNIGGVVMAVLAAVPGLIDLISLPRQSRARITGVRHAGFNVLALVLFAVSAVLLWRNMHAAPNDTGLYHFDYVAPLVLGIVGLLSTVAAGMLGWALVQTHHVGIRPTQHAAIRPPSEVDDLDELIIPATATVRVDVEPRFTERILRH